MIASRAAVKITPQRPYALDFVYPSLMFLFVIIRKKLLYNIVSSDSAIIKLFRLLVCDLSPFVAFVGYRFKKAQMRK